MELVDKYNERKEKLNKISDRHEKKDGEYNLYVHVCIMNNEGKIFNSKEITIIKKCIQIHGLKQVEQ